MNHHSALPIPLHPQIYPIGVFTSPKQATTLGSILAHHCAQVEDLSEISPSFAPMAVSECFEEPRYTAKQLRRANTSQVGKTFHIFNAKGELLRRGVVVEETHRGYIVRFADPLSGMLSDKQRVSKSDTSRWCWFSGVEESNTAYQKHFHITDEETTPSPRLVWNARELAQVL